MEVRINRDELNSCVKEFALDFFRFNRLPHDTAEWWRTCGTDPALLENCVEYSREASTCLLTLANLVKDVGQEAERNLQALDREKTQTP